MTKENAKLLLSQPVSSVEIDNIDQQYIAYIERYLEQELDCRMLPLRDREGYLVMLPAGTREETYAGQSTQWTHKTTLRFPNGATLQKYVASPLNSNQRTQTMLAFPKSILNDHDASNS